MSSVKLLAGHWALEGARGGRTAGRARSKPPTTLVYGHGCADIECRCTYLCGCGAGGNPAAAAAVQQQWFSQSGQGQDAIPVCQTGASDVHRAGLRAGWNAAMDPTILKRTDGWHSER